MRALQVLRRQEQPDDRPRRAAVQGREVGLGESCDRVRALQRQEGQPQPQAAGLEAAEHAPGAASLPPFV